MKNNACGGSFEGAARHFEHDASEKHAKQIEQSLSRRIHAVLFDLDGTLLDTGELIRLSMRHTLHECLGEMGDALSDEEMLVGVGTPLHEQMEVLAPGRADELCEVFRAYNHSIHDEMVHAFNDVEDVLRGLAAKGIAMAVVTSKRRTLALRGLECSGIADLFDIVIGPDECPRPKPAPDALLMGATALGVEIEECLYLGDSPYDMQAANAAGAISVAALWGMFDESMLLAEQPDYTLTTIRELPVLIEQLQ